MGLAELEGRENEDEMKMEFGGGAGFAGGSRIPQTRLGVLRGFPDLGIAARGEKLGVTFHWKLCAIPGSGWMGLGPGLVGDVPSNPTHSLILCGFSGNRDSCCVQPWVTDSKIGSCGVKSSSGSFPACL